MKRGLSTGSIIWIIFLIVAAIRIVFAFQTPTFSYDSYFHIRQVESILETGLPVFNDPLSYGGRFLVFSPIFHYIIAFFSLLIPFQIAAKILPNILYALLIPLSYHISMRTVGKKMPAVFAAVFAALIPGLWSTINSFDPLCMVIPLIFYIFYCIIRVNEKKYLTQFLIFGIVSAVISPVTILIVPALWLFILLLKIEELEERRTVMEAIIFCTFFILLINFLLYKKALLMHGYTIIWQNIPFPVLSMFFEKITVLHIIASVGIIPFIFGFYEIYRFSFTIKERSLSAIISLTIVAAILLWAKLIRIEMGMIFLGLGFAIISSKTIDSIYGYFKKIKFNVSSWHILAGVVAILLLTSIPPSVSIVSDSYQNVPEKFEIDAMQWLKANSSESSTIVATPKEGFLLNAVADRKNILDDNFLMRRNADIRYGDIKTIFATNLETTALELLNKYNAKYILLSQNTQKEFNVSEISYAEAECFKKVFENEKTSIFKTWCEVG
ncbi:hypothetical protein KY308_04140 [Candidatus Woesearchaeota archaeon]|nr:hypothetical protein [Candidatus Woesearchaeota archaeon]